MRARDKITVVIVDIEYILSEPMSDSDKRDKLNEILGKLGDVRGDLDDIQSTIAELRIKL